jgi:hypothetical protein
MTLCGWQIIIDSARDLMTSCDIIFTFLKIGALHRPCMDKYIFIELSFILDLFHIFFECVCFVLVFFMLELDLFCNVHFLSN